MAEIDQRNRTIRVKIVYYGPPLGGKTTNLLRLYALASETHRGEMISINSRQDRTILFDLLPLTTVGPHGFELRFQVLAVPGQAVYAATRRAVLRGADGVVFVANSATDRWQETVDSFEEMKRHLIDHGVDPTTVPLALQYNKRDLPLVTDVAAMDGRLRTRPEPAVPAVATTGQGVIETFEAILSRTLRDLTRRFRVVEMENGRTPQHVAREMVMGLFGRSPGQESLGTPQGETPAEPPLLRLVVPTAEPAAGGSAPRKRRPIVEAYAEACEELAARLATATAERDQARVNVSDVRRALEVANALDPRDLAATVKRMLASLVEVSAAAGASFALLTPDGFGRAVSLPGAENLLLDAAGGRRYLAALAQADGARFLETSDDLELWALLGGGERALGSLVSLPFRTGSRTFGLAVLYFLDTDPPPAAATLERLELLASVFAVPLGIVAPRWSAGDRARSSASGPVFAAAG